MECLKWVICFFFLLECEEVEEKVCKEKEEKECEYCECVVRMDELECKWWEREKEIEEKENLFWNKFEIGWDGLVRLLDCDRDGDWWGFFCWDMKDERGELYVLFS